MKTTKVITKKVEVIDDIVCNKCGESCKTYADDNCPDFEGLIEVEATGGYNSQHIGDMNRYKFSLCEKCLVEFVKTFKIDAFINDWAEYE